MGLTGGALGRSGFLPGRPVLHVWHLGGAGIWVGGWMGGRQMREAGRGQRDQRWRREETEAAEPSYPPPPGAFPGQRPPALRPTPSSPLPLPSASPSLSPPPPPLPVSCSPPLPSPPPPPARPLWLALRRGAGRRLRLNHLGAGPGAGPGSWAEPLSQLVGPSRSPGPPTPPRGPGPEWERPGFENKPPGCPGNAARAQPAPSTGRRPPAAADRAGTGAGPSRNRGGTEPLAVSPPEFPGSGAGAQG